MRLTTDLTAGFNKKRNQRLRPGARISRLACVLIAVRAGTLWSPASAIGQSITATATGIVADASGAIVPDAAVTITELSTGVGRKTSTNDQGIYNFTYLPPGTYRIRVEVRGFKTFEQTGVTLPVGATVRVDPVLQPGEVSETVNVAGRAMLLQTDTAEVSRTFEPKQITELPLATRSPQALVGLMPGVTPPTQDFTALEDPQGTTFFRANGQANSANNTQVDGVDNTNPTLGLTIYLPPAEVVQDVQIVTSNYNAEYGRAGGAIINMVSRGGTNELHGALYHFHRNTDLRARNFFNTTNLPKPNFIRNQFGGTLGGPIRQDKTFYFGSFQGMFLRQATTQTTSVPVETWRNGDFSGVLGLNLYDPATGSPDGIGRQPFAENRIPAGRIHSISRNLITLLPRPNLPGPANNLVANVGFSQNSYIYDGRIDHNFSDATRIFGKFNFSDYKVVQGAALGDEIGEATRGDNYTTTSTINLTHAFNPALLTEVRLGYNRYYVDVAGINRDPLSAQLGIRILNPSPESAFGLTRIQVSGMQGIGARAQDPLNNADNTFNVVNSWNKSWGRHQAKWGVDVRRIRADRRTSAGPIFWSERGRFDFNPGTTALRGGPALGPFGTFGNSFASLLLGLADVHGRSEVVVTPSDRLSQFFTFFHNAWQLSRKLTLDMGLRYELYVPLTPRFAGGGSNYNWTTNTLWIAGVGEVPMDMGVRMDKNNLAPRFGFAYRATEQTVIRGGYGLSYFMGRFGFNGGTFATQFPAVLHTQIGVANDFSPSGSIDVVPPAERPPIPANGLLSPAPNQPVFAVPFDYPIPFVHSYNLTIQRAVGWGVTLDAGYVGSLGRRLVYAQNLNVAPPGGGAAGRLLFLRYGRTADATLRASGVNNNYNSLQILAAKRFSGSLSFTAAYTWGKTLGVGDDQAGFINQLDFRKNYGVTGYDRRHMLTISHIYELPFGRTKRFLSGHPLRYAFGDWQLSGIFRAASGSYFTASADATPCNCPGNGNFADALRPVNLLKGAGPGQLWFDTSAFGQPGPNRFGTAGRNSILGPGLMNYDVSLVRNFLIRERMRLEIRGEFYNLTNTPHFNNPVGNLNAGNFGQITGAFGERDVQLAARITF